MSGRQLDLPQRQAVALFKAAKKVGGRVEYDPERKVYTLIPEVSPKDKEPVDEEPKGHL